MSGHKLLGEFVYDGCHYDSMTVSPKMLEGIGKLDLTSDDAIVATYAKSGTVWMKLMAYLVIHDGELPADMPLSEKRHMEFRFQGEVEEDVLRAINETPTPRLFSSHAHFRFIEKLVTEKKVKVIVVMRNPKDTLVSFFHFYRMNVALGSFEGTWDEFFEIFKEKRLWGGDIFDFNTAWWKNRDRKNIFITTFEEMKRDREGVIRKVAGFLGKDLDESTIKKILEQTSLESMRQNELVNGEDAVKMGMLDFSKSKFLRKGQVGDWKTLFSAEQCEYINQLCEKQCKPIGLTFVDSL